MKYSILLPSYDPELKNHDRFMEMIKSIDLCSKGKDYEIIIRKNSGNFVDSLNDAWRSASGDFLIFVHDDMVIQDLEWLDKLSIPDCFMTTKMGEFSLTGEKIPDWSPHAMHRDVQKKVGFLDEIFNKGMCYEDNDYIRRVKDAGIPIKVIPIKMIHHGGMSNKVYRPDTNIPLMELNKLIFKAKWQIP